MSPFFFERGLFGRGGGFSSLIVVCPVAMPLTYYITVMNECRAALLEANKLHEHLSLFKPQNPYAF